MVRTNYINVTYQYQMPFRRRRRRSNTFPQSLEERRKYNVYIDCQLPQHIEAQEEQKKILKWSVDFMDQHHRLPSTIELGNYVRKNYSHVKPYDKWEQELTLIVPCTKTEQELWVMGESMDAYNDYRNPDPKPKFTSDMCYPTSNNVTCSICLGTETGTKVSIFPCYCTYHYSCIEIAYGFSQKCPVCTADIVEFENGVDYNDIVLEIIV